MTTALTLVLALMAGAPSVLPPIISPASNTYAVPQTVTVTPKSAGSTIRCTTDGSAPTLSSARYLGPLTVSTTSTVKCRAWVQGKKMSSVASAAYTINAMVANACSTEPMRATGTKYYFCDCQTGRATGCVAGNDNNTNTINTPWQSWTKAESTFRTMAAGSTVAFCRGGSWTSLVSTPAMSNNGRPPTNANCTAGTISGPNTCDMRDYTAPWNTGSEGKPMLKWSAGQQAFSMGTYQNYTNTSYPIVSGFRFFNMDWIANNDGTSGGIRVWGKVTDLEICNMTFRDGFSGTFSIATTSTVKRINYHHNTVTNNPYGIGALNNISCKEDCVYDSNYFDKNGGYSDRDHTIYVGSATDPQGFTLPDGTIPEQRCTAVPDLQCYIPALRTKITNNEIRRSAQGPSGNSCYGVAVVVHEPHDDLLIENNFIYEDPTTVNQRCYGISMGSGGDAPAAFNRAIIRRNQVWNTGGVGIEAAECADCIIESNLIVASPNTYGGIRYPAEVYTTADGGGYSDSLPSTRGIIRNNTMYAPPGTGFTDYGGITTSWVTEGTGYIVSNNAVYGSAGTAIRYGANTTAVNNLTATSGTWFVAPGTNSATADFTPSAGSALIGAGNVTYFAPTAIGAVPWAATDTGKARDVSPDIGAYER